MRNVLICRVFHVKHLGWSGALGAGGRAFLLPLLFNMGGRVAGWWLDELRGCRAGAPCNFKRSMADGQRLVTLTRLVGAPAVRMAIFGEGDSPMPKECEASGAPPASAGAGHRAIERWRPRSCTPD